MNRCVHYCMEDVPHGCLFICWDLYNIPYWKKEINRTQLFSLSLDGQTQTVEIFRYTHTKSATSFLSRSIDRNWRKATCPYCKSWIFYMRSKLYTSLFTLSIRRSSTSTTKAEWQVPFLLSAVRFLARQHTECPALGIVNLKTS